MHSLCRIPCLVLLVAVAGSEPQAAPLVPSPVDRPVLVTTEAGPQLFQLLSGGDSLSFPVSGPTTLDVVARRRLPAASVSPPPVPLQLLGDGEAFLTVQVGQPHDPLAQARDGGGGVTSGPDVAEVQVPPGGLTLTLVSADGAPDLFVRIDSRAD